MPEEQRNDIFEIGIPKNIYPHTTIIIALHVVFIKIKQKQKFKNVVCALSQTEG